jgi:hypothetical protein
MKKNVLLLSALAAFFYITLSSYQNGSTFQAQNINRTEGPGSGGGCATGTGCHDAYTTVQGTGSIKVRKKTAGMGSTPVTSYQNDSTYYVTIKMAHPSLSQFGAQLAILDTSDDDAGISTITGGTLRGDTIGGLYLITHSIGIPLTDSATFEWKAPSNDSASVSIYGSSVFADGTGTQMGDSLLKLSTTVLTWAPPTSVGKVPDNKISISLAPNPVADNLNMTLTNASVGNYDIAVYDLNGRRVHTSRLSVNNKSVSTSINASEWASGVYMIHLSMNGFDKVVQVIKR